MRAYQDSGLPLAYHGQPRGANAAAAMLLFGLKQCLFSTRSNCTSTWQMLWNWNTLLQMLRKTACAHTHADVQEKAVKVARGHLAAVRL